MSTEHKKQSNPSIVLFSGGLDSTTILAMRRAAGDQVHALSFSYGQRHDTELEQAKRIAASYHVFEHRIVQIDLAAFGGSSLTSAEFVVPQTDVFVAEDEIPNTYVPARNIIFLSYALAIADVLNIGDIYIGVNALDYSGYPDCRPEFVDAYQTMARLGTRQGVAGEGIQIHAPLINMRKSDIIRAGHALGVQYADTHSCYSPVNGLACGLCDACHLRRQGFQDANLADPTRYASSAGVMS